MLHRLPELHGHADRDDRDERAGPGVMMLGATRSKTAVTGIASAAKFVPQRGEKRLGRTSPVQVVSSERSSAAAIARCSAPCRRSVRPRKSQRMISAVVDAARRRRTRAGAAGATKKSGAGARREEEALARAGDPASAGERRHRREPAASGRAGAGSASSRRARSASLPRAASPLFVAKAQ